MNLFSLPPSLPLTQELTTIITENSNIRIERIVSTGQITDWYDQSENEFIVLLQGRASLKFEDGSMQRLEAFDTLIIPSHKKHRVIYTTTEPPCIWLCIHYSN